MALLQLLLQQRAMRAMPLPARWQPALLNLLKALVLTGGATAETWLPLEYAQAADGFDAHDDHSAGKVISAPAMCAVQGGVVQLKGCAQCHYNHLGCFKAGTVIATLPPACRPTFDSVVTSGSRDAISESGSCVRCTTETKFIFGASIRVSASDGTLTVVDDPPTAVSWLFSLEGTVIPVSGAWGSSFLLGAALCGVLYVGGGVVSGSRQGRGKNLRAHPHYGTWTELRGLVRDGVSLAGLARRQMELAPPGSSGGGRARAKEDRERSPHGRDKPGRAAQSKSKGSRSQSKCGKGGSASEQPLLDTAGETEKTVEGGGGIGERSIAEQRDGSSSVHSSQQQVKVVSLATT